MGVERNGQAVPRLMNGRGELIPLRREGLSIEFVKPTPAPWLDSFAILALAEPRQILGNTFDDPDKPYRVRPVRADCDQAGTDNAPKPPTRRPRAMP